MQRRMFVVSTVGQRLRRVVLLERRQTLLTLLLPGLPVRLCLDRVEPQRVVVGPVAARRRVPPVAVLALVKGVARAAANAAAAKAVEAAGEEEEEPGGEGEPDGVAHGGGATADGVDAGLCDEEEGEVEDEGEEGDGGAEAGNAGAEAGHGELADVGEEAEEG